MNISKIKIHYVIILFLVGFIGFVIYNEKTVHNRAQAQLVKHGKIVSNALWNLDNESPIKYLEEAAVNNKYKQLTLKDDLGAVFINIDTDTIPAFKDFRVTIMPKIRLNSDVFYNDRKIGSISVIWQNDSVYLYINIFIISFLIIAILNLYLKLLYTNTNLESMVFERTSELESANRDLANHKDHLEELVKERTQELFSTQQKAIENAHRAGMADIANGVLHNIGNILNSVNTSAHIIEEITHDKFQEKFNNANQLLLENKDNLEEFILHNPKGKVLINYYIELGKIYNHNQSSISMHVKRLQEKIKTTIDVISSQQTYAGSASISEKMDVRLIVEDAINMEATSFESFNIKIINNMESCIAHVEKTKLIHIILNLLHNARDAMKNTPKDKRSITFTSYYKENSTYLKVSDTGCGISNEDLNNIFTHGFTTKKDGHGFGLHSCANYMTEMGAQLYVESKGKNQGAAFTLVFPQHL